jgi:Tfp pilus assembly protein PilX
MGVTMRRRTNRPFQDTQTGGITIVVTLMLLVLITVAAMGMSRNALRELAISGTSRQGSMARNVADSGIEWATYWIDQTNASSATGTAQQFNNLKVYLGQNPGLAGVAYDPTSGPTFTPYLASALHTPPADTTLGTLAGTAQGFTVALTRMGKLPITNMSQGVSQGSYTPAGGAVPLQAPDLWAIRSDSQITTGTAPFAMTFFHAKEAWVSTPAQ